MSAQELTVRYYSRCSARINHDYAGQQLLFVVVLNACSCLPPTARYTSGPPCEVCSICGSRGHQQHWRNKEVLGLDRRPEGPSGRDSGHRGYRPAILCVCSSTRWGAASSVAGGGHAFLKPECLQHRPDVAWAAVFPTTSLWGYGLDFDGGLGRNYRRV
jgi:hypothetical protein